MKVDIWSDIRCPFCYIGKRNFEKALQQFNQHENVLVEWHSYELDPNLKTDSSISVNEYLAKKKNQSVGWAEHMHKNVTGMAKAAGLTYDFNKAIVANSFDAHRLIQFAKIKNKGNEAEEAIFKAYFTDGADISDIDTLKNIGTSIGLNESELKSMLLSSNYTKEVRDDEQLAVEYGISGVPFFIIDNKYAISGAQPPDVFLRAMSDIIPENV
jgi:predicted DsbA family dithiol-disulfide isomerase